MTLLLRIVEWVSLVLRFADDFHSLAEKCYKKNVTMIFFE